MEIIVLRMTGIGSLNSILKIYFGECVYKRLFVHSAKDLNCNNQAPKSLRKMVSFLSPIS